MTKAREIAELGQKLTVDGSGNIEVAGNVTSDGLDVDGDVTLDPTSNFVTITGGTNDNNASGITLRPNWGNTSDGKLANELRFQAADNNTTNAYDTFATIQGLSTNWTADSNIGGRLIFNVKYNNASKNALDLRETESVFNNGSNDRDFRVESDNNAFMFKIDASSDYALFGQSGINTNGTGVGIGASGFLYVSRDSNAASRFNRKTSYGDIVELNINGNRSGRLGAVQTGFYIEGEAQHSGLRFASAGIIPRYDSADSDGGVNLGEAGNRFSRLFLTGGISDEGQSGSETVFNENSTTADFRVESDGNTHNLFLDAGTGRIGIRTASPAYTLDVVGDVALSAATSLVGKGGVGGDTQLLYWQGTTAFYGRNSLGGSVTNHEFRSGGTTRLSVNSGEVVVNDTSGADYDFRVESDTNANALFVDAGTSNVGINTSTPNTGMLTVSGSANYSLTGSGQARSAGIHVDGGTAGGNGTYGGAISFGTGSGSAAIASVQTNSDGDHQGLAFITHNSGTGSADSTEMMRLHSNGNLAIGGTNTSTSVPSLNKGVYLQSQTNNHAIGYSLYVNEGANNRRASFFLDDETGLYGIDASAGSGVPTFVLKRAGNEYYRVNSSGNTFNEGGADYDFRIESDSNSAMIFVDASTNSVRFGKTDGSNTAAGMMWNHNDYFGITNTSTDQGDRVILLNRQGGDGHVIELRRVNSAKGYIGVKSSDMYFGSSDTGLKVYEAGNTIHPFNPSTRANRDNAIDLGLSTIRFDDIYATNGSIQTSDQNEKQQIAALTDAEITAAKAISKLFKTFKWNDKVEAKGDAARKHTGVIAQQVEQAMTDAGLDAGDYAFFTSTTWWEDAEGEQYYTADDAPEGATERTRRGIRYPELLSFIGAATEQRLASIESRLDALESA